MGTTAKIDVGINEPLVLGNGVVLAPDEEGEHEDGEAEQIVVVCASVLWGRRGGGVDGFWVAKGGVGFGSTAGFDGNEGERSARALLKFKRGGGLGVPPLRLL